jgi:cytochrome c553
MKKILKWTGFVVGGLGVLVMVGIAYVFISSSTEMDHRFVVDRVTPPVIPTAAAEIAEGERLAHLTGCMHCHGQDLSGASPLDIPNVARFVAPNVTHSMRHYDDAQFAALMRKGVRLDGRGVYFMPSEMFRHLTDGDLARIIAYVRSVPQANGTTEKTEFRPLGRMIVAKGDFKSAAREIEQLPPASTSFDPANPVNHGRYLVMNFCSECHGQDLEGRPVAHSPSLAVVKSYSLEQFSRLMHEGVGVGERTFELMTPTSKARFSYLKSDEISAMHAYLQSRDKSG